MTAIILPQPGRGFWLNLSRGFISSFFTNTCLCIPLFPPILFSGAPALALSKCWRHSTESWESEVQGWGAVVISHLTVHYMECRSCLSGGGSDTHTHNVTISNSAWGSCLWVLVTHVLAHALLPWTFWSFLAGSWAFLDRKDIPHELIGAKQCLRPSLNDYLKHQRSHLPHTQTIHTPPV